MNMLAVFIGGGIGSVMRYGITLLSNNYLGSKGALFGTLFSNVLACLLLGVVIYLFKEKVSASSFVYSFLTVGVCGGFSTFSTFSSQTVELFNQKLYGWVGLNISLSIVVCFGILYLLSKQQG